VSALTWRPALQWSGGQARPSFGRWCKRTLAGLRPRCCCSMPWCQQEGSHASWLTWARIVCAHASSTNAVPLPARRGVGRHCGRSGGRDRGNGSVTTNCSERTGGPHTPATGIASDGGSKAVHPSAEVLLLLLCCSGGSLQLQLQPMNLLPLMAHQIHKLCYRIIGSVDMLWH